MMFSARSTRWAFIGLVIAVAFSRAAAATVDQEFAAAVAAAPSQMRDLACRDIATTDGTSTADQQFRDWYQKVMTPVARGITIDEMYKQLLSQCEQEQSWSVVDVGSNMHDLLLGLTTQHFGGK
jgi:hypothetical protein